MIFYILYIIRDPGVKVFIECFAVYVVIKNTCYFIDKKWK